MHPRKEEWCGAEPLDKNGAVRPIGRASTATVLRSDGPTSTDSNGEHTDEL